MSAKHAMPVDPAVKAAARVLWEYHRLGQPVGTADVILGLGSYDPAVAEHAAHLFLERRAEWLMFTGGVVQPPERMPTPWSGVEAEVFRRIALARDVPAARILVETRSTNTGENFRFSQAELRARGVACARVLTVSKPFMERRARATGRRQTGWAEIAVTSPPSDFEDYCFRRFPAQFVIGDMVGDLQRIAVYPRLGHMAPEPIPPAVWEAFQRLAAAGYRGRLIPGEPV
jgi:uncharacterized SAM-binding protein YcdF (DUF218 family)